MYTRYELYVDDEPQDIGILQGVSELDKDDDLLEDLMRGFDKELSIPQSIFAKFKRTKSWFTKKGEEYFSEDIKRIAELYAEGGLFEVKRLELDSLSNVIYEDEYQVIQKI